MSKVATEDTVEKVALALYECDGGSAADFHDEATTTRPSYYALARAAINAMSDVREALASKAYERGWSDGCETMLHEWQLGSADPELPHVDAMREGFAQFKADNLAALESLSGGGGE